MKRSAAEVLGPIKALLLTVYVLGLGMVALLVILALKSDSASASWVLALIWGVALLLIVRVSFRVFTHVPAPRSPEDTDVG